MKALIVDDEKHVRDTIRTLVDWEKYGITQTFEAADGEQAITLIKQEQPVLIFMDMMMPVKSGLELLEWTTIHMPYTKTIVISGHDDFQLVRHTLKHGGTDYLLKPIDDEQLDEAVQHALDSWYAEEQKRRKSTLQNIEANQLKPTYLDKIFSNLIIDPSSISVFRETLKHEFELEESGFYCCAIILSFDSMDQNILTHKFASNQELLFFGLKNICNEFVRQSNAGYTFHNWSSDKEIIIVLWDKFETIELLLNNINEGFHRTLGVQCHFGVGSPQPFSQGLGLSYREAKLAVKQRNLLDTRQRIHHGIRPHTNGSHVSLSDHSDQIKLAIQSSNAEQIKNTAEHAVAPLRALTEVTLEQLEKWWNEYMLLHSQWEQELMKQSQADPSLFKSVHPFYIPIDEAGMICFDFWQNELTREMLSLAGQFSSQQHKENNLVHEIKKFIQNNYNRDITLQDISNQLYVGREYISRRFKQETGENISEYIGRIRNEKAKLLLLNPNLKIAQIAEMIGYQDERYFRIVFKKLTNLTPKEFRKMNSTI
ncbi:two-component system, response regulator YesN [Paenibacillus sp. UNCCL117]|uniref:response regulator n=1 Tax=unclassified Paenibacillus TaxID=185978 RepID=UPI000881F0D6|nr:MULTISPECIES: response regulator [unclassified Paenibacillus]SDC26592.1 two-component system, response regulator YesN [Paenibacillus sp. cl123]SFW20131.1 two-component system, response regulator YesN [Paenibacillus sp. UNCCL117]